MADITKESLAARIAELESGPRSLKEDHTLAAYKMLLATMEAEPVAWIPVSEQLPEDKPGCYEYLVFETLNNRVNHDYWNVPDEGDDAFTPFWNYYGEHVTHWMPLPVFTQK